MLRVFLCSTAPRVHLTWGGCPVAASGPVPAAADSVCVPRDIRSGQPPLYVTGQMLRACFLLGASGGATGWK